MVYAEVCRQIQIYLLAVIYASRHMHQVYQDSMQTNTSSMQAYICRHKHIKYANIHMQAHTFYNEKICKYMALYDSAGICKKYEEKGMMYANTCKYMHYVSSNMHNHANYMLQMCNHMHVTRSNTHFCIYSMQFYVQLCAPPHMQLYAFISSVHKRAYICSPCIYITM